MIRPITCLTFLLACGSGLYLYQSKHRVALLDDQIAQIVKSTDALRAQTRMLSAEWTLLNDPERLRQLATQFLTLQTVAPGQFTSMADLDSRLPAVIPPTEAATPADGAAPADAGGVVPPGQVPVASEDSGPAGTDEGGSKQANAGTADAKVAAAPTTAMPKDVPAPATHGTAPARIATAAPTRIATAAPVAPSHPAEHWPPAPHPAPMTALPRLAASQSRPLASGDAAQWNGAQRMAEVRPIGVAPRVQRPIPVRQQSFQPGGSMLGMAHDMAAPPVPMPLPRPMPMNATQMNYGNGG